MCCNDKKCVERGCQSDARPSKDRCAKHEQERVDKMWAAMKKTAAVVVLSLLGSTGLAQVTAPPSVRVQDEGGAPGVATMLNCVGASVTCSVSGAVATMTIAGGSGGNGVEVSVNFGTAILPHAAVTVTGQSWVTGTSIIVCSPFGTTADGQTVENYIAARFGVSTSARVVGTGFDLAVTNPHSAAGTFRFHCIGV